MINALDKALIYAKIGISNMEKKYFQNALIAK